MVSHRVTLAGALSVVIHGSVVLFLLGLIGQRAVVRPPVIELTEVEVARKPPPPPPERTASTTTAAPKGPSKQPGRGQTPRGRSVTQAPLVDDPLADLAVSYDRPGPTEGSGKGSGLGALRSANRGAGGGGTGGNGTGAGARFAPKGPRPKHDYPESKVAAVREFVGQQIEAELTIDPSGRVIAVHVIHGIEPGVDERVTAIAKTFEFEPATDEHGARVEGAVRWVFVIAASETEDPTKPFAWRPAHPIY